MGALGSSTFPKKAIDLEAPAQIIDWVGRAALLYTISKPIMHRLLKYLRKPKALSFWDGQINTLVLLTNHGGKPALTRSEELECLVCLSKTQNAIYCLFEDKESEEIVPVCARCFREMTLCRKGGKELMTDEERYVWHLMRFGSSMDETTFMKAFNELNTRRYSHRDIRKKFLERVRFPMKCVTYY